MKTIEEYITLSKTMKNTSDGGSPAYHFEDGTVLVKYSIPKKYNMSPRENEEEIAKIANKKNEKGVRTPKHYAIKRVEEGDDLVCYVLQERAKGNIYSSYTVFGDAQKQLEMQLKIYNMPFDHYVKCVQDLCELFNMGLELKAKNIFYDSDIKNGGFTFIDLLEYQETPINPCSIKEILILKGYLASIFMTPRIKSYDQSATEYEYKKSEELYYRTFQKVLYAMERVLPSFNQYKRWIFRSLPKDMLEFYNERGIISNDLSLTDLECLTFDKIVDIIVDDSIEKIASGKYTYSQIIVNEIRIELAAWGLNDAWLYHNKRQTNRENCEDDYEFRSECHHEIEQLTIEIFERKLNSISAIKNEFIKNAQIEMQEKHKKEENKKILD